MILNEKRCSGNTLKLVFDCPWKAGFYCRTTAFFFKNCCDTCETT